MCICETFVKGRKRKIHQKSYKHLKNVIVKNFLKNVQIFNKNKDSLAARTLTCIWENLSFVLGLAGSSLCSCS